MADIAIPCGRNDLFALYVDGERVRILAVVGWDKDGRAIVQKADGETGHATRVHVKDAGKRLRFVCVDALTEDER